MRSDISDAIKLKTDSRKQTIDNNANPMLSLLVARKNTILDDFSFIERRRVRRTTKNSINDVAIAVAHPKKERDDTEVFVAYIKNAKLYLRHSLISAQISDIDWEEIDLGEPAALKCDIAFDADEVMNRRGTVEYITGKRPIVFFTSLTKIYYIDTSDPEFTIHEIDSFGVSDISVRQTPLGLALFYAKYNEIYYMLYNGGEWGEVVAVEESLGHSIDALSTFNAIGEFGIQAYSSETGYLYRLMGDSSLEWDEWGEVGLASGTGAIVEFYDGQKEAFLDNGAFNYYVPGSEYADQNWIFSEGPENLNTKEYSVIEFDHLNQGTLYFATIYRGDQDIIYFFRYAYMRDVSGYVQMVEHKFQTDNPVTQINATLKNIDDTLYTSEATLFAPSSIMRLGVSYGDSAIVPMGFAFIDQATIEYGGEVVELAGRNRTGVYLFDQTFTEDKIFVDTPSRVAEDILHEFGLDDYSHIDDSADEPGGEAYLITLEVSAETTGLEALETLNEIMTDDAANKHWAFEETYDGEIVVGYDDFRSGYIPKNYYTFNGRNDVFVENIDRCIDGVYSKVHVVGVTPKGKEISYVYDVKNFRFWQVGENRIYHADRIEGITKKELKKYAKALAKQLKYVGRVITYQMNLKPQLLIGDVAVITYYDDEEPDELGHITEITHTMGDDGYFTEFTITSGGNVTAVGYTPATRSNTSQELAYTSDKSVDGENRKRRLKDFFGLGSGSGKANAGITIIQGDSVNLPELIRNIGFRLLDEPKFVQIQYDEDDNVVKLKWKDPTDINTFEPVPIDWAGTVVVRNDNGAPLHPWDGTLIIDSTTRDAYQNDWLVDNNDIMRGNTYYYGIFPYHIGLNDSNHPIKHYRWTKTISIITGADLQPAKIKEIVVNAVNVTIRYTIPTLRNGSYTSITLVGKKNGTPMAEDDGEVIFALEDGSTSTTIYALDEETRYFWVIFLTDEQGNTAISDPVDCKTDVYESWSFEHSEEIQTFTVPKTGIYQLETWGASGGQAENEGLTARGGYGAYSTGEIQLTAGQTLYIGVGGQNGYNGGGNYASGSIRNIIMPNFNQSIAFDDVVWTENWNSENLTPGSAPSAYTLSYDFLDLLMYAQVGSESVLIYENNGVKVYGMRDARNATYGGYYKYSVYIKDGDEIVAGSEYPDTYYSRAWYLASGFDRRESYYNSNVMSRIQALYIGFGVDDDARLGYLIGCAKWHRGYYENHDRFSSVKISNNTGNYGTYCNSAKLYNALKKMAGEI